MLVSVVWMECAPKKGTAGEVDDGCALLGRGGKSSSLDSSGSIVDDEQSQRSLELGVVPIWDSLGVLYMVSKELIRSRELVAEMVWSVCVITWPGSGWRFKINFFVVVGC